MTLVKWKLLKRSLHGGFNPPVKKSTSQIDSNLSAGSIDVP
jgi:hypothetical protein